ncbi:MAG TPA: hypothetical protein VEI02_09600 [Planctomycetota bacterium]|nr:hypothetical protein [Planctomycetota bacterium]
MKSDAVLRASLPTLFAVLVLTAVAATLTPERAPRREAPPPTARAASPATLDVLPARLSELGLFVDLPALRPAPGVEAYDVRYPLWSDGAEKPRHLRLPEGGRLASDGEGGFHFPEGSTFSKTFVAPADAGAASGRKLETRILHKNAERWLTGAYVWNEAGDDADLTDGWDRTLPLRLPGCDADYVVPGRVSCLQCHAGAGDMVLGFSAPQLGTAKLGELAARGRLEAPVREIPHAEFEAESDVERDALGYLEGNCAHCHNPRSSAFAGAQLDLRAFKAKEAIGRPAFRLAHESARHVVAAGKPEASTLYRLFVRTLAPEFDQKRMPPVGAHSVDPHGRAVLERWIESLAVPEGARESVHRSE